MRFAAEFAHKTDKGKSRENNEDSILVCSELGLAIIADGMGGHNSGELASSIAVKIVKERFQAMIADRIKPAACDEKMPIEANRLAFSVKLANDVIYAASKCMPENRGMGTTLSAVLFNNNCVSTAHVGDSRIYLFRSGNFHQLTRDHSLVMDQVRKGLITKEQAATSPHQNILTRALGTQKSVEVDISRCSVMENDRFLLCTDGLFKPLTEADITQILSENPDNQAACDALVDMANSAGGPDNITVSIMEIRTKSWKESVRNLFTYWQSPSKAGQPHTEKTERDKNKS